MFPRQRSFPAMSCGSSAGDLVPADLRLIEARDLFVNQSASHRRGYADREVCAACGELVPRPIRREFGVHGSKRSSAGTATALCVRDRAQSPVGSVSCAMQIAGRRVRPHLRSASTIQPDDRCRFIVCDGTARAFSSIGLTKHDWLEALLFAVARRRWTDARNAADDRHGQSVEGRTAHGAHQVVVKRLTAIDDLGTMDVLCTDKTGTLTRRSDQSVSEALTFAARSRTRVLQYAISTVIFSPGSRISST